jgi:hypothetical protein
MSDQPNIFDQILAAAKGADKAELTMAHNGLVIATKAYGAQPGKQTKADYDAARALYDETLARLTAKYLPNQAPAPEGERFRNRKQAFDWLKAQGYKVSIGKFYGDIKAGFPATHQDGSVSRYQVMQYGQQLDLSRRQAPETSTLDRDEAETRLARAKASIEEMKEERMRREQSAQWLHRDEAWAALAALTGTLLDALRHHFHTNQGKLIHLAAGDQARGPELYEGCEEVVHQAFNEIADRHKLTGIFDPAAGGTQPSEDPA